MFRSRMKIVALSLLSLSLAATGCGGVEAQYEDVAPEQQMSHADHDHAAHADDQDIGTTESAVCTDYCDNCVLFARCRQPKLPYGLTYWSDKVAIINSNHAHVGCVAMIPTSHVYGHVAYVADVDTAPSPNRITLREANWVGNTCSSRTGTKDGLNIRNYWCPAGAHTANCAGPM